MQLGGHPISLTLSTGCSDEERHVYLFVLGVWCCTDMDGNVSWRGNVPSLALRIMMLDEALAWIAKHRLQPANDNGWIRWISWQWPNPCRRGVLPKELSYRFFCGTISREPNTYRSKAHAIEELALFINEHCQDLIDPFYGEF